MELNKFSELYKELFSQDETNDIKCNVVNISKLKKGDLFKKLNTNETYTYNGVLKNEFTYYCSDDSNILTTTNDIFINLEVNEDLIEGGKSDNISNKQIAKKKHISVDDLEDKIEKGVKVQREHTTDKKKQEEIAKDHIIEFKGYYEALNYMEVILKFDEEREVENKLSDDDKDKINDILKTTKNKNYKKVFVKILEAVKVESKVVENYLLELLIKNIIK